MPANSNILQALAAVEKDKKSALGLSINGKAVEPGQYVPRAEAQQPPILSSPTIDTNNTYLAVCIDLDAPFPSFSILGPILHWIQPGLKPDTAATSGGNNSGSGATALTAPGSAIANWVAPRPPPGSGAHRYVLALYEQPASFDAAKFIPAGGSAMGLSARVRYSLDNFEKEAKLGPILATGYFTSN